LVPDASKYRNVARSHYALQGWRREKVYPDFIFAVGQGVQDNNIVVLEMKGKHLADNDHTEYKKAVLSLMSNAFSDESLMHVGELELIQNGGSTVECDLVLFPEWKSRLPVLLQ
jgi:type III restriction enzyme